MHALQPAIGAALCPTGDTSSTTIYMHRRRDSDAGPNVRRAFVDFDEPEPSEEFDDDDTEDDDEDANALTDVLWLK